MINSKDSLLKCLMQLNSNFPSQMLIDFTNTILAYIK